MAYYTAVITYNSKTKVYSQSREPNGLFESEEQLLADYIAELRDEFGQDLQVWSLLSTSLPYPINDIRGQVENEKGKLFGFLAPTDQDRQEFELRYFAIVSK